MPSRYTLTGYYTGYDEQSLLEEDERREVIARFHELLVRDGYINAESMNRLSVERTHRDPIELLYRLMDDAIKGQYERSITALKSKLSRIEIEAQIQALTAKANYLSKTLQEEYP